MTSFRPKRTPTGVDAGSAARSLDGSPHLVSLAGSAVPSHDVPPALASRATTQTAEGDEVGSTQATYDIGTDGAQDPCRSSRSTNASTRRPAAGGGDDVVLGVPVLPFSAEHLFNPTRRLLAEESSTEEDHGGIAATSMGGHPGSHGSWARDSLPETRNLKRHRKLSLESTLASRRCVGWMATATLFTLVIAVTALGLAATTADNTSSKQSGSGVSAAATSESLAVRVIELEATVSQLQAAQTASAASERELQRICELEARVAQLQAELHAAADAVATVLADSAIRHAQVANITAAAAKAVLPAMVMLQDAAARCEDVDTGRFHIMAAGRVVCNTVQKAFPPTKVVTKDGARGDNFGLSLAIGGDGVMSVGAWDEPSGSVYVYQIDSIGVQPRLVTKLVPADGVDSDYFGRSIAISPAGLLIIGARGVDDRGPNSGSAYLYSGMPPTLVAKLLPPEGAGTVQGAFGTSVAVTADNLVVIGAPSDNDDGRYCGAVYLFRADTAPGAQKPPQLITKLVPEDGAADGSFGTSLALMSDTDNLLFVGSSHDVINGIEAGSVYVFRLGSNGTAPQRVAKIVSADGAAHNAFGYSIAVGPTGLLVIGAYGNDTEKISGLGAAYVYRWTQGGTVDFVAKLLASDGSAQVQFGCSVACYRDLVVVGAPSGAAYVYRAHTRSNISLELLTDLALTTPVEHHGQFGQKVAVGALGPEHSVVVVGARLDRGQARFAGAVYLYWQW